MSFEAFMAVIFQIVFFCLVMTYNIVVGYQLFKVPCFLPLGDEDTTDL
jgi:hypothetical protein